MFHKAMRGFAPFAAAAIAASLAGCDRAHLKINESEGVALSDLDISGQKPTELVLAGPDTVVVTRGDALAIDVEGDEDAVAALRFTLDETTLGVMREPKNWPNMGKARVRVTMPPLSKIVLAGSGRVETGTLASEADVAVMGSGEIDASDLDSERLDLKIAGSGTFRATGRSRALDLSVAGSGTSRMSALQVERADIKIMGSGDAEFASDGEVKAHIMGSGDVTVLGRATCKVNAMGSGKLVCRPGEGEDTAG